MLAERLDPAARALERALELEPFRLERALRAPPRSASGSARTDSSTGDSGMSLMNGPPRAALALAGALAAALALLPVASAAG